MRRKLTAIIIALALLTLTVFGQQKQSGATVTQGALVTTMNTPASGGCSSVTQAPTPAQDQTSGTVTTKAFTSNVTAGGTLVAAAGWSGQTATVTITDTLSNTYTQTLAVHNVNDGRRIQMFYAKNTAGGANTITMTTSGTTTFRWLSIIEIAGCSATAPLDQTNTGDNSGFTNAPNSGNVTTTNANEVLVGFTQGACDMTAGTSTWTFLGSGSFISATEYKVVTSVQTNVAATFTMGCNGEWASHIATFK